jgi:uncharacterized protein
MQYRSVHMPPAGRGDSEGFSRAPVEALILTAVEARVAGCLVEKAITTPEYYPMTLNALLNACNQKSNRHPVMSLNDQQVSQALESLRAKHVVRTITGGDNRVPKYRHELDEALQLNSQQLAVMTELLLRGPQTPGELNSRAARMYTFASLAEVEETLEDLQQRSGNPLVARLPKQPGTKEHRYTHLLSGNVNTADEPAAAEAAGLEGATPAPAVAAATPLSAAAQQARIEELERELESLKATMARLEERLGELYSLLA